MPNKPATTPEAPDPVKAERPKAASLFDAAPEPARIRKEDAQVSDATQPLQAGSDSDEDEEVLRETYAEVEAEEVDGAA